jgi:N4-(beta-N-acetylglucosaminyl)-L-asparaginase
MGRVSRRQFVSAGAGLPLAAVAARALGQAPAVLTRKTAEPVVIASPNGHFYKNGGTETGVERAYRLMTGGQDPLEALIAGVNIVELDPEEDSVGYGGLPNADGVVQLDSCCMHGPNKRAGGVAALEGVRTPSLVAHAVAQHTDHHLLVGAGAQAFARQMGFTVEADLNTEHSRKAWRAWKERIDPGHWLDPDKRVSEGRRVLEELLAEGVIRSRHLHGTINCDGLSARGELCGVTTTSGLAWKIPGRVGDSPILGAGLYVDDAVGAAGSTGRGEANLYGLSSFLIVEELRRGRHPKDAGMEALRRIRANTIEKRLRKPNGDPAFNISFYVLNARGEHAGVAMYAESSEEMGWAGELGKRVRYAVCDQNGPRQAQVEGLIPGSQEA